MESLWGSVRPLINSPAQKTFIKWASSTFREEARPGHGCGGLVSAWSLRVGALETTCFFPLKAVHLD